MGIELAMVAPPRCVLVNVTTGESMECLLNPTQLSEKVQVHWNRLAVPGLSHQVLQFQSTGNRQLSGVKFYLDRFFAVEQPGEPDIMDFRRFLRALTVPPEGTEDVPATAPPRSPTWPASTYATASSAGCPRPSWWRSRSAEKTPRCSSACGSGRRNGPDAWRSSPAR
jgi:hypothetical protein